MMLGSARNRVCAPHCCGRCGSSRVPHVCMYSKVGEQSSQTLLISRWGGTHILNINYTFPRLSILRGVQKLIKRPLTTTTTTTSAKCEQGKHFNTKTLWAIAWIKIAIGALSGVCGVISTWLPANRTQLGSTGRKPQANRRIRGQIDLPTLLAKKRQLDQRQSTQKQKMLEGSMEENPYKVVYKEGAHPYSYKKFTI